jgi:hypothetical protein
MKSQLSWACLAVAAFAAALSVAFIHSDAPYWACTGTSLASLAVGGILHWKER